MESLDEQVIERRVRLVLSVQVDHWLRLIARRRGMTPDAVVSEWAEVASRTCAPFLGDNQHWHRMASLADQPSSLAEEFRDTPGVCTHVLTLCWPWLDDQRARHMAALGGFPVDDLISEWTEHGVLAAARGLIRLENAIDDAHQAQHRETAGGIADLDTDQR